MYFSRLTLKEDCADSALVARKIGVDGYKTHQLLWSVFEEDPSAGRDFLYRRDDMGKSFRIFIVSSRPPVHDHGIWRIETKTYDPIISNGDKLAFKLRVNPVVTRRVGPRKRHARHDVVMNAKMELKESSDSRPLLPQAEIVDRAGREWIEKKAPKFGFKPMEETLRVGGYNKLRFFKKSGRHTVHISVLDFSGVLLVTAAQLFKDALFNGIGPAKSFGCGLMMVRRL
jgi:CRISPR system Cascade subunit CasE